MTPKDWTELFAELMKAPEGPKQFQEIATRQVGPAPEGKYRHWDMLRNLQTPDGLTHEQWLLGIKLARLHLYQDTPLLDTKGQPFKYATVDLMLEMLHQIDKNASGAIRG